MSILIKGMKMPSECEYCGFCRYYHENGNVWCNATNRLLKQQWKEPRWTHLDVKRPEWCPLIGLPEKHGRLIDADALHVLFENQWHYLQCLNWDENPTAEMKQTGINWCINTLHDDAPTIIEAEGDEE